MEPLITIRKALTVLYLNPLDEAESIWKKIGYAIIGLSAFVINVCLLVSCVAYFLKFVSTDFEGSLYALFEICAYFNVVYSTIVIFCYRDKIKVIFQQFTFMMRVSFFCRFI